MEVMCMFGSVVKKFVFGRIGFVKLILPTELILLEARNCGF
jgi:hypothetical protein